MSRAAQAVFAFDRTVWGSIYGSGKFFQRLGMHLVNDLIEVQVRLLEGGRTWFGVTHPADRPAVMDRPLVPIRIERLEDARMLGIGALASAVIGSKPESTGLKADATSELLAWSPHE